MSEPLTGGQIVGRQEETKTNIHGAYRRRITIESNGLRAASMGFARVGQIGWVLRQIPRWSPTGLSLRASALRPCSPLTRALNGRANIQEINQLK